MKDWKKYTIGTRLPFDSNQYVPESKRGRLCLTNMLYILQVEIITNPVKPQTGPPSRLAGAELLEEKLNSSPGAARWETPGTWIPHGVISGKA